MSESITIISQQELDQLWLEGNMPFKRAAGLLVVTIVHDVPARDPRYLGGRSRVLTFDTRSGQHLGTIHQVVLPDGAIPHDHPKDYTRRDCSRVRVAGEER